MNLELNDIGKAIAIGGITIFGVVTLLRFYFPGFRILFFRSSDRKLQVQEAAVYLALVFAVGIIIENASKNAVANRDKEIYSFLFENFLEKDTELRLKNLFKVNTESSDGITIKETSLSKSLFTIVNHPASIEAYLFRIKKLIEYEPQNETGEAPINYKEIKLSEEQVTELKTVTTEVYYAAKNSVFRTDNYFKELTEITGRIDFLRSFVLICYMFSFLYFLTVILSFFYLFVRFYKINAKRKSNDKINAEQKTDDKTDAEQKPDKGIIKWWSEFFLFIKDLFKENKIKSFKPFYLGILFLAGAYLSSTAYRAESTNYNLRVFGYYISQKLDVENSKKPNAQNNNIELKETPAKPDKETGDPS